MAEITKDSLQIMPKGYLDCDGADELNNGLKLILNFWIRLFL